MSTAAAHLSEADFDALTPREGYRVELNHGGLVMTASPRYFHNRVRDHLGNNLLNFADTHGLGDVLWETEFLLGPGLIRIPDLAFLTAANVASIDPHARLVGAPDLAIEISSPSNDPDDLVLKAQQFLNAGTRLVWVLYPEARLAYIYRPGERVEIRDDTQSLDAPELLPGWTLPLAAAFGPPPAR